MSPNSNKRLKPIEFQAVISKAVANMFEELKQKLPEDGIRMSLDGKPAMAAVERTLHQELNAECMEQPAELIPGVPMPAALEDRELSPYKEIEPESEIKFWFNNPMVSRFAPLFDNCHDNHAVEELLKKDGVIDANDPGYLYTDTESSCFYIYFKTAAAGHRFMKRLRLYLEARAKKIKEAYE